MKKYSHQFVETYDGLLGFGWERETDEKTLICYLQMISDDALAGVLVQRMDADELEEVHDLINHLLKKHLNDSEYHRLFLKEDH